MKALVSAASRCVISGWALTLFVLMCVPLWVGGGELFALAFANAPHVSYSSGTRPSIRSRGRRAAELSLNVLHTECGNHVDIEAVYAITMTNTIITTTTILHILTRFSSLTGRCGISGCWCCQEETPSLLLKET